MHLRQLSQLNWLPATTSTMPFASQIVPVLWRRVNWALSLPCPHAWRSRPWRHKRKKGDDRGLSETGKRSTPRRCTLSNSSGNAHGFYTKLPHLDFERLAKLQAATRIPLVLHGGSGTPQADLRRAISLGIAKVNVATEVISAVRQSLLEQWGTGKNLWTPIAQAAAMQAMAQVVEKWFHLTNAAGRT